MNENYATVPFLLLFFVVGHALTTGFIVAESGRWFRASAFWGGIAPEIGGPASSGAPGF